VDTRRFGIALVVAAAVAGVMLWLAYGGKDKDEHAQEAARPAPTAPADEQAETRPDGEVAADKPPAVTSAPAEASPAPASAAVTPGRLMWWERRKGPIEKDNIGSTMPDDVEHPEKNFRFTVETVNEGGAINTIKLADYFFAVDEKRMFDADPAAYAKAMASAPEDYQGHYCLVRPVSGPEGSFRPLATRRLTIKTIDGKPSGKSWNLAEATWRRVEGAPATAQAGAESIAYEWKVWRGRAGADGKPVDEQEFLTVTKTYTVRRGDYSISVALSVENHSPHRLEISLDQAAITGVTQEDRRSNLRQAAYGKLDPSSQSVDPSLRGAGDLTNEKKKLGKGERDVVGASFDAQPVLWIGNTNKFFAALLHPVADESNPLKPLPLAANFYIEGATDGQAGKTFVTGVQLTNIALAPAGAAGEGKPARQTVRFDLFAGPKKRSLFGENPLYDRLEYIGTIDFKGCFCAWDTLSLGMMWLLEWLSRWPAFGNYGVAIILLVAAVRLLLHPLTRRSQLSMLKTQKQMAALQPQMQKLREKYKGDRATLNREMMSLYKQAGTSPMAPMLGCLPMLLQMPIWIAMWTAVNASVELRHAAFLPVWITDLAAPDMLIPFGEPVNVPLLGPTYGLNLLPLLLVVAMYLQTKLNPQMSQATMSPEQQSQQKMMKFMMPVMMLFIFYNQPSGLTMYISTSISVGVVEQYLIRKHARERDAEAAAAETTIRVPGRGPRASRPKKPKGPFWTKRG